jgi:sugar (pentulose or hexulose) kinase
MADVFNAEVVTLKVSEGAAYGAALQALWCWRLQQDERVRIEDITGEFVTLNNAETAAPDKKAVAVYRELQDLQDALSQSLRGVFARRARLLPRLR